MTDEKRSCNLKLAVAARSGGRHMEAVAAALIAAVVAIISMVVAVGIGMSSVLLWIGVAWLGLAALFATRSAGLYRRAAAGYARRADGGE